MSYIAIARKYRPTAFEEVIGQEAIGLTLKNAIKLDRVHHAYLFHGPRGVGKTSMARILSKALCCEKGPAEKACGKCGSCQDIDASRSLDVLEIDGASNRGIDDVRAIRENVKFAPTNGKYKIYIIDEVHQITPDAFNALLKTLEEPPAHAKFIFATTAVQKVPATILSRCQRFDFKRIPADVIAQVLENIVKKEKFTADKDALFEIAKAADGSLRDSQSLLDQCASFSKGKITIKTVSDSLGIYSREFFLKIFDAVSEGNAAAAMEQVNLIFETGRDPVYFLESCMEHVRDLMLIKASPQSPDFVEDQKEVLELKKVQASKFSGQDLFYFFSILTKGVQNTRFFSIKRAAVEMAVLKCVIREPMVTADGQLRQAAQPKAAASRSVQKPASEGTKAKTSAVPAPSDAPKHQAASDTPAQPKAQQQTSAAPTAVQDEIAHPRAQAPGPREVVKKALNDNPLGDVWPECLNSIRNEKMSTASYLTEGVPVDCKEDTVIIGFPEEFSFHKEALQAEENLRLVEKHLSNLMSKKMRIEFILHGSDDADQEEPEQNDATTDTATGIFGGRVIDK